MKKDIPALKEKERYFFKRYKAQQGESTVCWYQYMIQTGYKARVQRGAYDRT